MLNATATALCLQVLSLEPEDHRAVAVPRHGGTPDKTRNSAQARQPRLNAKLRAPGNRNCWARGGNASLDPAAPPKAAPACVLVGQQPLRGCLPPRALPGIAWDRRSLFQRPQCRALLTPKLGEFLSSSQEKA